MGKRTEDKGRTVSRLALAALVLLGAFTVSCSSESPTVKTEGPVTFMDVDAAISQRVAGEGLEGAALLVVRDGQIFRNTGYAKYNTSTVVPIASASKWLTAATMLSLVDDGRLTLDDKVNNYLPEFTGTSG